MGYADFFKGKRVTILGLGLLGRSVGDAEFIASCGADVLVTDVKGEEELAESLARLKKYPNISFKLGGHDKKDFTDTDMVIKAAGVHLDSPEVAAARAAGVPVYMSTALAAQFAREIGAKIVGVTGTRGKSTAAHMLYHALVSAGRRAHLGGNVRGISTLALLPDIQKGDTLVLELDSWQLQGFGDLKISPNIAIFTNLMPDHQNYYSDMGTYFNDKANIFRFQEEGDFLIVGSDVAQQVRDAHPPVAPNVPAEGKWQLKIPGEHNAEHATFVAAALKALEVGDADIKKGIESFEGVEGRLQFVREVNGVKIYNDNNATTPEATIAALRALDEGKKNIILIMGGSDKGLELGGLVSEIDKSCKSVILLEGTGTVRFEQEGSSLELLSGPNQLQLKVAVDSALQRGDSGDVVLFSPAFASFGAFNNEYHRNDEFLKIVNNL